MDGKKLYPLTHPQQRIWYTEKLHPGTGMWNNSGTAKIKGLLDVEKLETAVNLVLKSNEALRIRITQIDGEPFQYVTDYTPIKPELLDFSQVGTQALYEWDSKQSQAYMPIQDNALFYFAILKISPNECGLYAKVHHIIYDAWSAVMVCDRIMENYDRLLAGMEVQEQTGGSYIDFIAGEKEYLNSKRFFSDQAALSEMFSNLPEPTVFKQKKSNYTSLRARRKSCIINKALADKMREYCKRKDTSIFALYLAGLCVYINRLMNKNDIIIGVPVFNRINREEKNTVGMFVSTVPVRIKVEDNFTFDAFVKTVSNEWFKILKHQRYPYEMLLSNLRRSNKDLDSLYDIALSYQNAQFKKNTANFTYEARWHFAGSQVGSLSIHINDREGEGRLIVDYDHQVPLFSLKEIEYIHTHCETILVDAISHPDKKLYELNIMEPEELNRILHVFNANKAEYPLDCGLDTLFQRQVNSNPDAVALIAGRERFTYSHLNGLVNKLAFYLKCREIGRNSVVGIIIQRDYTLIVSILAVLRAGGAFLPIDPDFPADRVQFVLQESGAHSAITSPHIAEKCGNVCQVITTDILGALPQYMEQIPSNNNMRDLAYVIYTSGSTGKPKGVIVEQRSIVHFIYALSEIMDFSPSNIVLAWGNISFDIFIMETFPTLLNGGTLVLAGENEYCFPQDTISLIRAAGINKILSTPTRLQHLMIDKKADECLKSMKEIMLGGDILQKKLLTELKEKTSARIFNFYGPTEATIASTFKEVTESGTVNIGSPLPNIQVYILDQHRSPVPIGTKGEIYVGGIGVARGYINRPDLSALSFLDSPFHTGEQLYKTGDIARWYPRGEIEYIGRADQQIKIRGLRIELGEISNAISEFQGVQEAVVVDYRRDSVRFLCAYYTKSENVDETELRSSLRKRLPVYMIPSIFIGVDNFPMTPSGKLDKNALPNPESLIAFNQKKTDFKGMSATEKKMATVWRKVLKVKRVSRQDNFFELGGDSLGVIRVQNEMLQHDIELSIQDFYELQTLDAICTHIDDGKKNNKAAGFPDCEEDLYTTTSVVPSVIFTDSLKYIPNKTEPLYERILSGKLAKLDSAALTYIPNVFDAASFANIGDTPVLYNYMDTGFGNAGVIALPISGRNIYTEKDKLISLSIKGIRLAKELGASVVSLTGLIPSATDYGMELAEACAGVCPDVQITTGHTTTAASVILSLERLLRESGRNIIDEKICVLGMGSIGTTVIKLLLSVLPHPVSITLCDIIQKKKHLDHLMQELKETYGSSNQLCSVSARGTELPDEVYDATLIIGATNVPDIVDVSRLKPGTLIIDDSGPHCFSKEEAVARLKSKGDILFTEGGVLQSPNPLTKTTFLPPFINPDIMNLYYQHFLSKNEITGCILSGLLSAKYEQLKTVVGPVANEDCMKHYEILKKLSFDGAPLHCDDYVIPVNAIEKFRSHTRQTEVSIAK